MAKYRPLDKKERELTQRQVVRMNTTVDYYKYRESFYDLMIDNGAFHDYKMAVESYKIERRKVREERIMNEETLKICNEQLTKGVEVTEKAKETRKEVDNEINSMVKETMENNKDGNN